MFAVGCGDKGEEIKREDAVSLLSEIKNVELPDKGITICGSSENDEAKAEVKVSFSKDKHIAYSIMKVNEYEIEMWVYPEDDKLISASRIVGEGDEIKYYSEVSVSDETLDKEFDKLSSEVENMINFDEMIENILNEIKRLDSVAENDTIAKEKYFSNGYGNLTAEFQSTINNEDFSLSVSIDQGIVRSLVINNSEEKMKFTTSFSASIKKPKIDDTWIKGF